MEERERLAKRLYDQMEKLAPSQETIEWDDITSDEKGFYFLGIDAVLDELNN
jgi:hypothetical protein